MEVWKMTNGAAAAGAAAAVAQAIRASGAIVRVEPQDFMSVLAKATKPIVVVAEGSFWARRL